MHGPTGDALGLFPAGTCSEAQESDRVRVVVRACLALLEEMGDLIQGEERKLDLIGLDLPDIGQRVGLVPRAEADQLGEDGRQVATPPIPNAVRFLLSAKTGFSLYSVFSTNSIESFLASFTRNDTRCPAKSCRAW